LSATLIDSETRAATLLLHRRCEPEAAIAGET
jgi:hypothetical protein